jgi:hypothetical protein
MYYLKIAAPGFERPIPINVAGGRTSEVQPAAGVIAFHWTGAASVLTEIWDWNQRNSLKTISCGSGQVCNTDVAPGRYYLKIAAPGFEQPILVSVRTNETSVVPR